MRERRPPPPTRPYPGHLRQRRATHCLELRELPPARDVRARSSLAVSTAGSAHMQGLTYTHSFSS